MLIVKIILSVFTWSFFSATVVEFEEINLGWILLDIEEQKCITLTQAVAIFFLWPSFLWRATKEKRHEIWKAIGEVKIFQWK